MFKTLGQFLLTSLATCVLCACGGGGDAAPGAAGNPPPVAGSGNPPPAASAGVPPGYALVWADEFTGNGLPDPSKWSYDTEANATGWYNHELQYYAAGRLENSQVSNGALVITARKEALTSAPDYGGQAYTSARLITRGKASWTYGFFEVRAKLPCGQGTWPAIWMLGANNDPWPANGEIDIMEQVGMKPTEITGTVHTAATAGTFGNGGMTQITDACTNFHNYQLTWTAAGLAIGVDNVPYFTYKNGSGVCAGLPEAVIRTGTCWTNANGPLDLRDIRAMLPAR